MKTDAWFYRFFRECPGLLFRLLHRPASDADDYVLEAVELKDVSLRLDGVFRPTTAHRRTVFVEAQLYRDPDFYLDWMAKIFLYLRQQRERSDWQGLVLFGSRRQDVAYGYGLEEWVASGRVQVVYLDELPDDARASPELAVLKLTVARRDEVLARARQVAGAIRSGPGSGEQRSTLLALIEALVVGNFPKLSREEILTMLELHDIRESTIFQEGRLEGLREAVQRLLSKGHSLREIAELLELDESVLLAPSATTANQTESPNPN